MLEEKMPDVLALIAMEILFCSLRIEGNKKDCNGKQAG
jgi:hypothetical protein